MRPFNVYGLIICTLAPPPQNSQWPSRSYHTYIHSTSTSAPTHGTVYKNSTSYSTKREYAEGDTNHEAEAPPTKASRPPNSTTVWLLVMAAPRNVHTQPGPRTAQSTAAAPATRYSMSTSQTPAPTRPAATLMPAGYARDLIQPHSAAKIKARLLASTYHSSHRDLKGP